MRSSTRRPQTYFALVLFAAVFLIPFYDGANAKSPKAGYYAFDGETVEADPGEDPHMKVDPMVDFVLILDTNGGTSSTMVDDMDFAIMGQHLTTGYIAEIRKLFVQTYLIITMKITSGF